MDTLTAQVLVFGLAALAFGGFASFMAIRQTDREKRERSEAPQTLL